MEASSVVMSYPSIWTEPVPMMLRNVVSCRSSLTVAALLPMASTAAISMVPETLTIPPTMNSETLSLPPLIVSVPATFRIDCTLGDVWLPTTNCALSPLTSRDPVMDTIPVIPIPESSSSEFA